VARAFVVRDVIRLDGRTERQRDRRRISTHPREIETWRIGAGW
jgi:hypothetical protein